MNGHTLWAGLFAALAIVLSQGRADSVHAQPADPTKQPLIQAEDFRYLGAFSVDASDGSGTPEGQLTYGGWALSVNSAARTLLMGAHVWHNFMCEVAIPEDFARGTRVVQACADVTDGRLGAINPVGGSNRLGGSLVYKDRLIVSAYVYYDAEGRQTRSHFMSGLNLSQTGDGKGPFRVGSGDAGFVSGYMGLVPPEWQSLLGGPAVTGNCCLSIISRTSSGPALWVFDPDDVGREDPVPAKELVGYPLSDELARGDSQNLLFNLSTEIKGVLFPSGTRSVMFVGRIGEGAYCYGEAAACKDPTNDSKGTHMYPYRHQVWAYDANHLHEVARGKKDPSDLKPYATWQLREMNDSGSASIAGATYDPSTSRLYITEQYGETPKVHVYEIAGGAVRVPSVAPASPQREP